MGVTRISKLAAAVGAAAALTIPAGAAVAAPGTDCPPSGGGTYPGNSCTLNLQVFVYTPGATVSITVHGFAPRSHYVVILHSQPRLLAKGRASGGGDISTDIRIPTNVKAGTHTLIVRGTDASGGPRVLRSTIKIAGTAGNAGAARAATSIGGTGAALPSTGSSSSTLPLAGAGAGLVIVGAGFVAVSRRRRSAQRSA